MVKELTTKNFDSEVTDSKVPVIIDVFADWCGPCMMMKPVFQETAEELGEKYNFLKVNVDEQHDLAVKYNVSSIPTLIFIKEGKIVGRELGYMNKESLISKIESLLG